MEELKRSKKEGERESDRERVSSVHPIAATAIGSAHPFVRSGEVGVVFK